MILRRKSIRNKNNTIATKKNNEDDNNNHKNYNKKDVYLSTGRILLYMC